MAIALVSFGVIFLLVASGGLLMFYRQAMVQRLSEVVNPRPKADLIDSLQRTGSSIGGFVEQLDRVLPKSKEEVSIAETRLVRAGFRTDSAIKIFYGAKVLVPFILC